MTTPDDLAAAIEARLRPLANPERAAPMRAYLLGQFDFLGIATPARRAAIKDLVAQPLAGGEAVLAAAERLWRLPERECRYAAIDLLRRQQRQLEPSHLPAIQALLLREPWWETVDGLVAVIGAILLAAKKCDGGAQAVMDAWVAHPSFWARRAAVLHQLGWRLQTDTERLGRYCGQLAHEREFFIRKAVGWALRDYARWDPDFVRAFIADNAGRLSGLTVREACRRLPAAAAPMSGPC